MLRDHYAKWRISDKNTRRGSRSVLVAAAVSREYDASKNAAQGAADSGPLSSVQHSVRPPMRASPYVPKCGMDPFLYRVLSSVLHCCLRFNESITSDIDHFRVQCLILAKLCRLDPGLYYIRLLSGPRRWIWLRVHAGEAAMALALLKRPLLFRHFFDLLNKWYQMDPGSVDVANARYIGVVCNQSLGRGHPLSLLAEAASVPALSRNLREGLSRVQEKMVVAPDPAYALKFAREPGCVDIDQEIARAGRSQYWSCHIPRSSIADSGVFQVGLEADMGRLYDARLIRTAELREDYCEGLEKVWTP